MTKMRNRSALEEGLNIELRHAGLNPRRQHRFCERRWLFDFAWPDIKLAVEVDGGTWVGGRHTRPQGFAKDCEKLNRATMDGWRVLRYTGEMVRSGEALQQIRDAVKALSEDKYGVD